MPNKSTAVARTAGCVIAILTATLSLKTLAQEDGGVAASPLDDWRLKRGAIYAELLGPSLGASVNGELLLKHFAFRIGTGITPTREQKGYQLSLPVTASYLSYLGLRSRSLAWELGLGAVPTWNPGRRVWVYGSGVSVAGTGIAGFRALFGSSGMWRLAYTPILGPHGFANWFGISIGGVLGGPARAPNCQKVSSCDVSHGTCAYEPMPDGIVCSDGKNCTTNDRCHGGRCVGVEVSCEHADQCHIAGTCEALSGTCTNHVAPDGTVCYSEGGLPGRCRAGICAAVPHPLPEFVTPRPTPLGSRGDALYSIYRRGLVSRHIAKNGRFMTDVALEKVPGFEGDAYWLEHKTHVDVGHSACTLQVPISNVRYSMECDEACQSSNSQPTPELWVPVLGPLKYPGLANDARWVMAADGDNPNYYGGYALALFSLEAKHGVSRSSLSLARSLVRFMLESEIPGSNGYLARRARFFLTSPTLRGASIEEILGTFLGLVFYLKVEDPSEPLYAAALGLRDRILAAVESIPLVDLGSLGSSSMYDHPYFTARFPAKAMVFPLQAAAGRSGSAMSRSTYTAILENYFLACGDCQFWEYSLIATSMLLITESTIPSDLKRGFISQMWTFLNSVAEKEGARANNNGLLAITEMATKKAFNGKPTPSHGFPGAMPIITEPTSAVMAPETGPAYLWQHDLPLGRASDEYPGSREYNPSVAGKRRIGKNWTWASATDQNDNYAQRWPGCPYLMPGWPPDGSGCDYVLAIGSEDKDFTALEYLRSMSKTYTAKGYFEGELAGRDLQVEGSGLDLLFARMFLTELDPVQYPAPKLTPEAEAASPLPFDGPGFLPPSDDFHGRGDLVIGRAEVGLLPAVPWSVLKIATVGPYIVTVRPTGAWLEDQELVLEAWKPPQRHYEQLVLAASTRIMGSEVELIPLEAARFALVTRICRKTCSLRVSEWGFQPISDQFVIHSTWDSAGQSGDAAGRGISVTKLSSGMCGPNKPCATLIVGTTHSQESGNRASLRVFSLTDTATTLTFGMDTPAVGKLPWKMKVLSSRGGKYFFYNGFDSARNESRFYVHKFDAAAQEPRLISVGDPVPGQILDAAVVSSFYPRNAPEYIVAVTTGDSSSPGAVRVNGWTLAAPDVCVRGGSGGCLPEGSLAWTGRFEAERGDQYLLTQERDWTQARIIARGWRGPWFVIAAKGPVLTAPGVKGGEGLTLLHGRMIQSESGSPAATPTIEGIGVAGDGALRMPWAFDIADSPITDEDLLSAHWGGKRGSDSDTGPDFPGDIHLTRWKLGTESRHPSSLDGKSVCPTQ